MNLDRKVVDALRGPIVRTWHTVCFDMVNGFGNPSNEQAIECCIDTDILSQYGEDSAAGKMVSQLCSEHGGQTVVKFLSENINLL